MVKVNVTFDRDELRLQGIDDDHLSEVAESLGLKAFNPGALKRFKVACAEVADEDFKRLRNNPLVADVSEDGINKAI
ncbi:MAG: hypothetical protein MI867_15480 [Pseudomonadales bacterium]|nr:hypothetical protein [Pseudomonadales bacterium]